MNNQTEALDAQLNMKISSRWARAVDTWRASQWPIISRAEAIRVLVLKAIEDQASSKK